MKNETLNPNVRVSNAITAQSLLGACLFVATVFACANLIGCGSPFESRKKELVDERPVAVSTNSSVLKQTQATESQLKNLSVWRFYDRNQASNTDISAFAISTDSRVQSKFTVKNCAYHVVARTSTHDGANGTKVIEVVKGSTEIISAESLPSSSSKSPLVGVCMKALTTDEVETLAFGEILQMSNNIITVTKRSAVKSSTESAHTVVLERVIPADLDSEQNCENPKSNCLQ